MPDASRVSRFLITLTFVSGFGHGCQESGDSPAPRAEEGELAGLLVLTGPCTDHPDADAFVNEMLDAVNRVRERRGIRPLTLDATLSQIADFYSCRLVEGRFFRHVDPYDGSTLDIRAADFGYAFQKVGENLAAGQSSVADAMKALMSSEDHRANIMDPEYSEIGIAVKLGGAMDPYWVQEFGRPLESHAEAPESQPADATSMYEPVNDLDAAASLSTGVE